MKLSSSKVRENVVEMGLYLIVGAFTSIIAFFLATGLMSKSKAQNTSNTNNGTSVMQTLYQNAEPAQQGPKKKTPAFDEEMLKKISTDPDILNQTLESVYNYESKGKRDPFQPYFGQTELTPGAELGPVTFLQRFELKDLKLIGIIWDVARPKAMISDPAGGVHVIEVNGKIGRNNSYVGAIREGEIVVVEPFEEDGKKSYNTKVIAIGKAD